MTTKPSNLSPGYLQAELEALQLANAALEAQMLAGAEQMDVMLREVESQRNALQHANRRERSLNDFAQRVMDTVGSVVIVLSAQGRIERANRYCEAHLAKSRDDLRDSTLDDLLLPLERKALAEALPNLPWPIASPLFETVRRVGHYKAEHLLRSTSGNYRHYLVVATMLHSQQGKEEGAVVNATDITELKLKEQQLQAREAELREAMSDLKRTQAELLHGQKLQSIGQLAAGIAHEINTPTQYLLSNISFLQESFEELLQPLTTCYQLTNQLSDNGAPTGWQESLGAVFENVDFEYISEETPRALTECMEGLNRISGIVLAMKDFAHPGGKTMVPVDLDRLIRSAVEISRNEWKLVAELETELATELPTVEGLKDELGQVLLNLIVNAAHAIGDCSSDEPKRGKIHISTACDASWVTIHVSDNGCGIPVEIQDKIFDPFFTTKEVGRGSGQGLAIAYNVIVGKHKGELAVDSTPGIGTTFAVRLPYKAPFDGTTR